MRCDEVALKSPLLSTSQFESHDPGKEFFSVCATETGVCSFHVVYSTIVATSRHEVRSMSKVDLFTALIDEIDSNKVGGSDAAFGHPGNVTELQAPSGQDEPKRVSR